MTWSEPRNTGPPIDDPTKYNTAKLGTLIGKNGHHTGTTQKHQDNDDTGGWQDNVHLEPRTHVRGAGAGAE